jgi:hypothetical protein
MLTKNKRPKGQAEPNARQEPRTFAGVLNHPHHPHHHGGDDALVLPSTFPDNLRWQALFEAVKLRAQRQTLEHGGYTEKAGRWPRPLSI